MLSPRKDYRQASLFRTKFASKAKPGHPRLRGIAPFDFADVLAALQKAIDANDASTAYTKEGTFHNGKPDNSHRKVTLEEVATQKVDGAEIGTILRFSYLDPYAADPGKQHLINGNVETLVIGPDEAGRTGAHLFIGRTSASGPKAGTARCVLEQMPGLSRSKIISNIQETAQRYLDESKKPTYQYSARKNSPVLTDTANLNIRHYPEKSESLEDDLKDKSLEQITFLGPPSQTDNLGINGISEMEQKIVAKVASTHKKGSLAQRVIEQSIQVAKKMGVRARADFSFEDDFNRHTQRRELDLDKTAFSDQLFTRIEKIVTGTDIPSVYTSIDPHVVAELVKLGTTDGYWDA